MYSRPHHQRIQVLLESLNHQRLQEHHCLFGGGTAIVLAHGEYRESVDVDFIVSSSAGYRALRGMVSAEGMTALLTRPLSLRREARIDQYGIRCALEVEGVPIKFEIVFEGRVVLADPQPERRLHGVWTLAPEDQVATKLMANSDRWADSAVWSRDLIDLAMLTPRHRLDAAGVEKALLAYGESVLLDFEKARHSLLNTDGRLATCMSRLQMSLPEAALRKKLAGLKISATQPGPSRAGS